MSPYYRITKNNIQQNKSSIGRCTLFNKVFMLTKPCKGEIKVNVNRTDISGV